VQVFPNEEFGPVRVVMIDGEPWFVAKDVAEALGYSETSKMMRRLDEDEFRKIASPDLGGANSMAREFLIINESGLYNAILGSHKPEAKRFKKWVTSKVLPSIRKKKEYKLGQEEPISREEYLANAAIMAQQVIAEKNIELEDLKRTKAWISRTREATAMATASANVRKARKLQIEKEAAEREKEKALQELEWERAHIPATGIRWLSGFFRMDDNNLFSPLGKALTQFSREMGYEPMDDPHVRFKKVNRYHKDVIAEFRKYLIRHPMALKKYRIDTE